jgi:hypothetical protein
MIVGVETDNATSMRARARHGVLLAEPEYDVGIRPNSVRPPQGPAPLWSKDSGRRLLPGESIAGQGALPLPRWQVNRGFSSTPELPEIAEAQALLDTLAKDDRFRDALGRQQNP